MREILFRGKRLDTGEWVEGFYATNPEWDRRLYGEHHWIISCKNAFQYEIDPATVGQYTGLTDRNGKRIFEGDVVNGLFLFGMSIKAVVVFKGGAFGLEWKRGNVTEFSAFTSICNVKYEVVGNIHDNPELLEGGGDREE